MKEVFCIGLIVSVMACNDSKDDVKSFEQQIPEITVNAPASLTMYTAGDTVWIQGSFSDPVEIHSYSIHVIEKNTEALVEEIIAGHSHIDQIPFNTYWKTRTLPVDTVQLVFKVSNHNGLKEEDRIAIVVQ